MGIADRHIEYKSGYRRRRFTLGQQNNALVALVALNIIVFVFILTGNLFYLFAHQGQDLGAVDFNILRWFALPAHITELGSKPWSILTFMFAHGGGERVFPMLLDMLVSMLWIWSFGFILQDLSGNKFIFPVYIYGGLLGGLLFILAANGQSAPAGYFLSGAGASTAALAVTVAALDPDYRIFRNIRNGMPIWILSAIYVAFNIWTVVYLSPYAFAVLGGALGGFLFVYFLKRGHDGSTWMNNLYNWFVHMFDPAKIASKKPVKDKMFYNTGNRAPFVKTSIVTQKRIDELLDKINQRGYDALTEEEKTILKKAAEADDL